MLSYFDHSLASVRKFNFWWFTTVFRFLVQYRRTSVGPIWILLSPLMFVLCLGALLVGLSSVQSSIFIPHLTIGYIAWTLLGGYLSRSVNIFKRNEGYILQGNSTLSDVVFIDNLELIVHFLHQSILIFFICLYYDALPSIEGALISFVGFIFICINGFWVSMFLGILCARFSDLGEIVKALVSVLFITTPIIWMAGSSSDGGRILSKKGEVLQIYMNFNPFYHFLDVFRAPWLGQEIADLTWMVVVGMTVIGFALTALLYGKTSHVVTHWVR